MKKGEARDEALANALAAGATVKAAGEAVGLTARSVYLKLADPAFKARVAGLRSKVLDGVVGKLAHLAGDAVDRLAEAVRGGSEALAVRAALGVLEAVCKVRTHAELEGRLAELERKAGAAGQGASPRGGRRVA